MSTPSEEVKQAAVERVGNDDLHVLRRGSGDPLLMLHDELGYPGWMTWNQTLADFREFWIPLQPGFGDTPRIEWAMDFRDLANVYIRWLRESGRAPIDAVAFSAGGYLAAEMAAADPSVFRRLVLVAPLGIRPDRGDIFDFFAVTLRTHVAATVARHEAPEFGEIYGGEMTPDQFERFEDARAESARIGWEPFMHSPSLRKRIEGVRDLPTLVVWGDGDLIAPRGCAQAYSDALPDAALVEIPGVGHRPEIEDPDTFLEIVTKFFGL